MTVSCPVTRDGCSYRYFVGVDLSTDEFTSVHVTYNRSKYVEDMYVQQWFKFVTGDKYYNDDWFNTSVTKVFSPNFSSSKICMPVYLSCTMLFCSLFPGIWCSTLGDSHQYSHSSPGLGILVIAAAQTTPLAPCKFTPLAVTTCSWVVEISRICHWFAVNSSKDKVEQTKVCRVWYPGGRYKLSPTISIMLMQVHAHSIP